MIPDGLSRDLNILCNHCSMVVSIFNCMAYMSKFNRSVVRGGRQARTRRAGAEQRNQASIKSAAIKLFK
jgi:hypothetical protein